MVVNLNEKDFFLIFVLHIIFLTVIPAVNYILVVKYNLSISVSTELKIPLVVEKSFFYPIMGYYMDKILDMSKINEYSCAAEPPVRCGESHLSRLTGATNILFC